MSTGQRSLSYNGDDTIFVRGFAGGVEGGFIRQECTTHLGRAAIPCIRQRASTPNIKWKSEPLPKITAGHSVTFVWAGMVGSGEGADGNFILLVNGHEAGDFDVVIKPTRFVTRADGCILWYDPVWINNSKQDSSGYFYLKVPAAWTGPGEGTTIEVQTRDAGMNRWFGLVSSDDMPLSIPKREWRVFFPGRFPAPPGWGWDYRKGNVIVTATNPRPEDLPTLSVYRRRDQSLVCAAFPKVEGTFDAWCYESAHVSYIDSHPIARGKIELRHRINDYSHAVLVTTVTPEPGALDFVVRPELEKKGVGVIPDGLKMLNICWQLYHVPAFSSAPETYPDFIKRCFVFTERGCTFLDKSNRVKSTNLSPDHPCNNPPWMQVYICGQQWLQEVQDESDLGRSDSLSPDRCTIPVMGAVSRNGKYLAAAANDSGNFLTQAWLDCVHANPRWMPDNVPPDKRFLRVKLYVMENNPEVLLTRFTKDFPTAMKH